MGKRYLIIALMLLLPQIVLAAPNATINTDKSQIEKGESVTATVTLDDAAAWNIEIKGSGAASCSKREADVTIDAKSTTKEFTLSCMSTKKGTITFEVTGDITSGTAETKDISITKNVTVIKASSDKFNIWLIILVIVAISIILIVFLLNKKKNKKDENDNIHSNMNVGLNKKKEIDLEDIE